ncbi:MAG: AMP-binding protein [Deltaproteobacteria bacterium]|nr:AMP-binding protein [Deltaproteobacteria bacterium]
MDWLNIGQTLSVNAKKIPDKIAFKDAVKSYTYAQYNKRVNKLSNAFLSAGLKKGDKAAVLMENSIEITEVFFAAAKTGLIIVPINFRLTSENVEFITNNSDAKIFIADKEFTDIINPIKPNLKNIGDKNFISVFGDKKGYTEYETFIKDMPDTEPNADIVRPEDPWILIYTSGTTGKPKGVIRSHKSHIAFYLINAVEFRFTSNDTCMNVMPLYHINSTFYTFTFTYIGGSAYIHPARSFKPEQILQIIEKEKITFISLIPTHYNLILSLPKKKTDYDVSSVKKLLCSSAPARKDTKLAVMDFFKGVELYEAYGSTEAGIVTVLKPEEQLKKLGSMGKEVIGTELVKLLDENGKEVKTGEVGELYSKGPMLFDKYYKLPEKTAASFKNGWFTAGDMAKKDKDGFFECVDRKDNMIITGGEHVYPSEVEEVVGSLKDVFDCACISISDNKWGEKVCIVVNLQETADSSATNEDTIKAYCKQKLAGYKCPKDIIFIKAEEMPRTPTGKILHRKLRERFNA